MILTLCLNPVLQKTLCLSQILENSVNRCNASYLSASGKGINVCRVLQQLGRQAIHVTQLGGRFAQGFLELVAKDNLHVISVPSQAEIRFCYTLLNVEHHSCTEIVEEAEPVHPDTEEQIITQFLKWLPKVEAVTISGSKAPGFSDSLFPYLVETTKLAHKKILIDYRGKDLVRSLAKKPDFIKINYSEFCLTFLKDLLGGQTLEHLSEPELLEIQEMMRQTMKILFMNYGIHTIVTQGSKAIMYWNGNTVKECMPEKIHPVNTIGSGDAFAAGFISDFLNTNDLNRAIVAGADCAKMNALQLLPGTLE